MGRPALPLRASQNLDANPVAAPIILLMPALYLPVGLGMPLPNLTCAKTLTKADPVLALHALTNTGVTSPDAQQPTLWKTTQQRGISQIHDHWKEESGFKKPEVASSKYSDNNNFLPLVAISFVNYCSNLGFFSRKMAINVISLHPAYSAFKLNNRWHKLHPTFLVVLWFKGCQCIPCPWQPCLGLGSSPQKESR